MFNTILNPLSQFEIIDFLYFEASLIDNIHISMTNIGFYVQGVWIDVVQWRGFLYNYLARRVQDFRRGSSRSVKNKSEMCPFNSELHPWAAVKPSHRDIEIQPLSKGKYTPKGSPLWFGNIIYGGGKHSLLKLGSSLLFAYRHY